jgi:hypothetical protein
MTPQTSINDIEVIDPIILSPIKNNVMKLQDLTIEEIEKELAARKANRKNDIEAYKKLVAENVMESLYKLTVLNQQISDAKTQVFLAFETILDMKANLYGVKEGQQTHSFSSEMGEITIGYRIHDGWDDTANTGIEKVKIFISGLANNEETANLVKMVLRLLQKDTKGNLKGSRVLELQKLAGDFNNPLFNEGVQIIADSFKPVRSVWFLEASLNKDGKKTPIPLNISAVDFSPGYSFNYNYEQHGTDSDQSN